LDCLNSGLIFRYSRRGASKFARESEMQSGRRV